MARFCAMHLAPTLFGGWDLVREWDRIGSPGTLRIDPFETLAESERALPSSKSNNEDGDISKDYCCNVSTSWIICTHDT
jgi:predicted DNA-binding WGR domain protein